MMEIESEGEDFNDYDLDMQPLSLKTDKKLVLSHEAESVASSIYSRRNKTVELNRSIDPNNIASRHFFNLKTRQFGTFQHFLTKNKHRQQRVEVLNVMRDLAQSKDHVLSGRISDKLERSKMILRVISKEEFGLVKIQDETGNQKMKVKRGTVWVGMIALMEVVWEDNCYKLEAVYDLGTKYDNNKTFIAEPNAAYRMLFVKGALMNNQSKDNIGLKVIMNELNILKEHERTKVSCLVIMGPLLNSKNKALTGFSELTFQEEAIEQIKVIKDEFYKSFDDIELVFMPSTDDLNSYYPIPQPKYSFTEEFFQKNLHFTSNPGFIHLQGVREKVKIDLLNLDLLNYIDENRTGSPFTEIMQENLETYFKQPFYLTNAMDEPFDQTNLPALYNQGNFGDIIVTSSRKSPPFAREVRGKVFVNIGSLGIDEPHLAQKHFMTLLSIYDGSGPLGSRTKVQVIAM